VSDGARACGAEEERVETGRVAAFSAALHTGSIDFGREEHRRRRAQILAAVSSCSGAGYGRGSTA